MVLDQKFPFHNVSKCRGGGRRTDRRILWLAALPVQRPVEWMYTTFKTVNISLSHHTKKILNALRFNDQWAFLVIVTGLQKYSLIPIQTFLLFFINLYFLYLYFFFRSLGSLFMRGGWRRGEKREMGAVIFNMLFSLTEHSFQCLKYTLLE